jgi:hypothetical protein
MATDPPYSGTIYLDGKIITTADPTAFLSVTDAGQAERSMFDRRLDGWKTFNAYLFNAKFDDGLAAEIWVNPEFGSSDAARIEAKKYGAVIGKLPKAVRTQVKTVSIHQGVQLFGGGENLVIHTGQADQYERDGFLEETLLHEACHTLDAAHSSAAWIAARTADKGTFISTYARDNPEREDVAESFLCWLAVRYRRDRISKADADKILGAIPNRIAYFDAQAFEMYPIAPQLTGTWTYRCFNPRFVTGYQTPQENTLIRAEAVLTLRTAPDPTGLVGTIEWPGLSPGVIDVLDVNGTWVEHSTAFKYSSFHIRGLGRAGTETDGWEYEYHGHLMPWWPRGTPMLEHRPTLVGSVIRVKPHGDRKAGEVFSFIAMKPPGDIRFNQTQFVSPDWGLTGSWLYRSFHNNHTYPYLTAPPTGTLFERTFDEPNVYHGFILQEAVFKLETFVNQLSGAFQGKTETMMRGTIEWTGGGLTLEGEVQPAGRPAEVPLEFSFRAFGRPGTETDGWDFAYFGRMTWQWPKGVAQRPALVGSVNVFYPRNLSPNFGFVYPFIAVKQD